MMSTRLRSVVFTEILACPRCEGTLGADSDTLRCDGCRAVYPIDDGIPILLLEGTTGQESERVYRDRLASRDGAGDDAALLEIVGRHHCRDIMARRAAQFAGRFSSHEWILDLGIGWGWQWRSRCQRPLVLGVDMSLGNLRLARRLLGGGRDDVVLVCADATALPLRRHSVAGAWSVQVLQHMPPAVLSRTVAELDRVLAPVCRIEASNLNPGMLQRALYRASGRRLHRRGRVGEMELSRRSPSEWRAVWSGFRPGHTRLTVGYSELFFHPDLWVRPRRYPVRLERTVAAVAPVFAGLFARQVDVTIESAERG